MTFRQGLSNRTFRDTKLRDHLMGRRSMRTAFISLGLALALAGCGTTPKLDTFSLSAGQVAKTARSHKSMQLLIQPPTALKALDSENIVVNTAPGSIEYLGGAQWGDRLTNIVQARLVQSFENSGLFGGIGRPGDGLAINYQVLTDLRVFGIRAYGGARTAVVDIAVRLMNDSSGEIRATRIFTATAPVRGTSNADYVRALNTAFEQVSAEIVNWAAATL